MYTELLFVSKLFKPIFVDKGVRPIQHLRSTGCAAEVVATQKVTELQEGVFTSEIHVTPQHITHTHPVNARIWAAYAENRKTNNPEVIGMVCQFLDAGTAFRQLFKFVTYSSGKPVTFKDVRNLIQSIQSDLRKESMKIRVQNLLDEFVADEPGNVARICGNGASLATCVAFQTAGMRKLFSLFPEVVLVDSTHKTNDLWYKLFSFMVTDAFGKDQFAQRSFVDQETDANMSLAVETFQENNPEWTQVEVIMVDKDLTEIGVLEKIFPKARVLLCRFHVFKWFRQIKTDARFDLSRDVQNELLLRVRQMVYAKSASRYEETRNDLFQLLNDEYKKKCSHLVSMETTDGNGTDPFVEYFQANWESCTARWVEYTRSDNPHLGNHTNNCIESGWSKMKPDINVNTPLDQCIEVVLTLQMFKEKDFERQTNEFVNNFELMVLYHAIGETIHA
ncbi:Zinc finger SWIM domain-containing protein 3 [Phytophthora citrophthora]|uniref:Zinc finger SWIM domain-containing protein 3 n=1 Tax=Phytophthora citrophthora TaxID=4793 RepID=A0AAD9GJ18_9STRA|nr:Zinc finger SWIM domain-containing protein 3 [Phytophthora citrophthora]